MTVFTDIRDPTVDSLPDKPGIYKLYSRGAGGDLKLLYVGEADSLRDEIFNQEKPLWDEFTFQVILDDEQRTKLMKHLVREFDPPLNRISYEDPFADTTVVESESGEATINGVSSPAVRMLKDVAYNPYVTHTERYSKFSTRYQGNSAKNELVDKGLVTEKETAAASGKRKLLELTRDGRTALEAIGISVERRGRGGVIHRYWQNYIKGLAEEQDLWARIETHDADVAVKTENMKIAFEVAMKPVQREITHMEERLDADFDQVVVVSKDDKVQSGLRDNLPNSIDSGSVQFLTIRELCSPNVETVQDMLP